MFFSLSLSFPFLPVEEGAAVVPVAHAPHSSPASGKQDRENHGRKRRGRPDGMDGDVPGTPGRGRTVCIARGPGRARQVLQAPWYLGQDGVIPSMGRSEPKRTVDVRRQWDPQVGVRR
ncbi:hypothetical protein LZ30DRAFT_700554 [Colletotrichum cereale]|nr:hypothetical protein LZ30DRAFT_700554 [Colletotrichum cereale]